MTVYRRYSGIGTLIFLGDGFSIHGRFSIECKSDGRTGGEFKVGKSSFRSDLMGRTRQTARLTGKLLKSATTIVLSKVLVHGATMKLPGGFSFDFNLAQELRVTYFGLPAAGVVELRFGFVNFLFLGPKFNVRLLSKQFIFNLIDSYKKLSKSLPRFPQLTAEAVVLCSISDIEGLRRSAPEIAKLISFAAGTYVSVVYTNVWFNGKLASTEIQPIKVYDYYDREPLIEIKQHPQDFRWFLEKGIKPYLDLKSILGLNFALEYCVLAKSASPVLQVKYLMIFMAMEAFLEHFVSQQSSENKRNDFASVLTAKIDCIGQCVRKKKRPSPQYLVLKKLRVAQQSYSVKDTYRVSSEKPNSDGSNYEDIRNRLSHSGDFPDDVDPFQATRSLRATFERLLLAVLTYRGHYIDCANGFQRIELD